MTAVSANALTLTTESDGEVTVPLVDATTYTRGSMGGQASDGNPPEMPGIPGTAPCPPWPARAPSWTTRAAP